MPAEAGTADRIRSAWAVAAARGHLDGRLRSIVLTAGARGVSATVGQSGEPGILVSLGPVEQVSIPRALRLGTGGVLRAEIAHFGDPTLPLSRSLHVWCADSACAEAFAMFCELLVDRTAAGASDIADVLEGCHEEFRRLVGGDAAAMRSIAGLVGELLLLRDATRVDARAPAFWLGPSGGRHDFRHGAAAIEVKTTLRSERKAPVVRISDIDQLAAPSGGDLFLHFVGLEKAAAGGLSISLLVEEIRALAGVEAGRYLTNALEELPVGLRAATDEFSAYARKTYEVRAGFPRLTEASFVDGEPATGLSSITYDIDLSLASAFIVADSVALHSLLAGVSP